MPKAYIRNKNREWVEVELDRELPISINIDWGGCTGERITIGLDELWNSEDSVITAARRTVITKNINGTIIIDGERMEGVN